MAYKGSQPFKITLEAGADLSAKQFYFVKVDSSTGKAVAIAADTDVPVGVLQNKPTSGQAAEIVVTGLSKVSSDAGITAGALVGTSADGQAITRTVSSDATKYIVGQMLTTTGGANVVGSALINCASPARAA